MAEDHLQTDITDFTRRMQALFNPNGAAMPQVEQLLTVQQEMVRQTETFTRHWLERRQEAAETGLEALQTLSKTQGTDPAAALRAMADWQRGSFKRVSADLQDWVALCTQITQTATAQGATTQGEAEKGKGASQDAKTAKPAKPSGSKPRATSGVGTQHATPV
ncbi:MAG: hypothetical protein ACQEUH_04775 [Pseudomonadota bacterium]